ncbi:hypothetical protein QWY84_15965 [Aquisalimonas lutea]|uniref:hypothetical protein n=1 Tax=Aquisalimonas lutea TaxID=1327750 RepID=UPI0025B2C1F8|nr:hypothetical protein [Aquisalimonas lutea]MDN3519112.1 hypothetical protein [Aquisalimonas lutea]
MVALRINKVFYEGDQYYFESPDFGSGLNIIEGDNGTGKTTFFNLLYYGIGGVAGEFEIGSKSQKHQEITSDKNNWVLVDLTIGESRYVLRRWIGDNEILVTRFEEDESGNVRQGSSEIYPLYRNSAEAGVIFSDWLLENLGVPAVELSLGSKEFIIKSNDLFRLVYHDQAADPDRIYKTPDQQGFVADSNLLRQVIFQLWMGKAFAEYYQAISEEKRRDRERQVALSVYQEYERLASELLGRKDVVNLEHLRDELWQEEARLEGLRFSRRAVREKANSSVENFQYLTEVRNDLYSIELNLSTLRQTLIAAYEEQAKLLELRKKLVEEVDRIDKILLTHTQMNLFSSDTCPYCLSSVERATGHCVCGAPIEEEQYERFFYTSHEYKELLKSKRKALETVEIARDGVRNEIEGSEAGMRKLEADRHEIRSKLMEDTSVTPDLSNADEIEEMDDAVLAAKERIESIKKAIDVEKQLEERQAELDRAMGELERARRNLNRKETEVSEAISERIDQFSYYYSSFMRNALPDCRTARIDKDNYMPVINNGEYREASASVPKRLMYFMTLMQMSLTTPGVQYPRFNMIDTPETMGIESQWLKQAVLQFMSLENPEDLGWQVILSTGLGKYPEEFEDYVVLRLRKERRLLGVRGEANTSDE